MVDKTKPFLVLETHYDNSDQIEGNNDNSGVRLYYTDTMRKHEAGSIQIGDSLVTRGGRTVENGFEYEHSCPSECTSKFNRSIKVYGSFLHMHTTGKEIYTNVFSRNGTFLDTMNKVSHFPLVSF